MFRIGAKIVRVDAGNVQLFSSYCREYGREHDDSYLPEGDWLPDDDNPTYIMVDSQKRCVGAVSAMLTASLRSIGRCRLRILHTLSGTLEDYEELLDAIYHHLDEVDCVYLFVPEERTGIRDVLEAMAFVVERYSWCLAKSTMGAFQPSLPDGFSLKPFRPGVDDDTWCRLINTSFAGIKGHLYFDSEGLRRCLAESGYRPEGMLILCNGSEPVGTLRVTAEIEGTGETYAEIGALSVLPQYRRQGLGKALVRTGVWLGRQMGFDTALLSVNAENVNAAELYLCEGFEKIQVMICYNKFL